MFSAGLSFYLNDKACRLLILQASTLSIEQRLIPRSLWKTRFEDQQFTSLHGYIISGNVYIIYGSTT